MRKIEISKEIKQPLKFTCGGGQSSILDDSELLLSLPRDQERIKENAETNYEFVGVNTFCPIEVTKGLQIEFEICQKK